jgi:hypothetical protein
VKEVQVRRVWGGLIHVVNVAIFAAAGLVTALGINALHNVLLIP